MTRHDDARREHAERTERLDALIRKIDQYEWEALYSPVAQFGAFGRWVIKWTLAVLIVLGLVALFVALLIIFTN